MRNRNDKTNVILRLRLDDDEALNVKEMLEPYLDKVLTLGGALSSNTATGYGASKTVLKNRRKRREKVFSYVLGREESISMGSLFKILKRKGYSCSYRTLQRDVRYLITVGLLSGEVVSKGNYGRTTMISSNRGVCDGEV